VVAAIEKLMREAEDRLAQIEGGLSRSPAAEAGIAFQVIDQLAGARQRCGQAIDPGLCFGSQSDRRAEHTTRIWSGATCGLDLVLTRALLGGAD
jgi:hypothetical protein